MTASVPELDPARLAGEPLTVIGQLRAASNATVLCALPDGQRCVYKPVAGERPLWDFPDGTLAGRELAFAALDAALGIGAVPTTVWREEGPFGPGMCQAWIDEDDDAAPIVDVVPEGEAEQGWVVAFRGEDEEGRALAVVHRDDPQLVGIALLDAAANNADRKAGHLLVDPQGRIRAIDHGVSFHVDEKLRTVLWGWAGEPVPDSAAPLLDAMSALVGSLPASITTWLSVEECHALEARMVALARARRLPVPSGRWPAVPWPIY